MENQDKNIGGRGLQVKTKTRKSTSSRNCVRHGDMLGCLETEGESTPRTTLHHTTLDGSASRRGPVHHLQCSATTLSVCFHRRTCWHSGYDYQRLRGLWTSGGVMKCPAMTRIELKFPMHIYCLWIWRYSASIGTYVSTHQLTPADSQI